MIQTVLHCFLTVLAGKLAAEVVSERAANLPYSGTVKAIEPSIVEKALRAKPKDPVGVLGEGAIAFGVIQSPPYHRSVCMYVCYVQVFTVHTHCQGGSVMSKTVTEQLKVSDPEQLVALG